MRHNLLIVDDEELIRQGLKARLEYLGIDVDKIFEASNGNEAIEVVKNHTVDIVVTDIRMPDMDGLTLIREVQKIEKKYPVCSTQRVCRVYLCGTGDPSGGKIVSSKAGV